MPKNTENLIWIDLEMTGLDTVTDMIIEIATMVTDKDLTILAEGPVFAIHQPDAILEGMDEWNRTQHRKTGLWQRVQESSATLLEAEQATLDFLKNHVPHGKSPMCGNSICQDRRFLFRQMPILEAYFHYRHIDVSTIKELAERWRPELLVGLKKQNKHLALEDIKDSIEELRFYREHFFHVANL